MVILVFFLIAGVGGVWYYYKRKMSRARVVLTADDETGEVMGHVSFETENSAFSGLSISADGDGSDTDFTEPVGGAADGAYGRLAFKDDDALLDNADSEI